MATRRTYKRDRRGRFASTGSTRVKRIRRTMNRRRPRYVRGSLERPCESAAWALGANMRVYTWARSYVQSAAANTTLAFRPAAEFQRPSRRTSALPGHVAEGVRAKRPEKTCEYAASCFAR